MESDGGIDTNELNTVLSKSNIKSSADITEKFNELDTNKNGKVEESELSSITKGGEDYFFGGLLQTLLPTLVQNLPQILQLGGQILQGILSQKGKPNPADYERVGSGKGGGKGDSQPNHEVK